MLIWKLLLLRCPRFPRLFLLFDGKAKGSDLFAKLKILAVSKGRQMSTVKAKLAFLVQQRFIHIYRHNICNEHIVTAERLYPPHPTFEGERCFSDRGGRDLGRGDPRQMTFFEKGLTTT